MVAELVALEETEPLVFVLVAEAAAQTVKMELLGIQTTEEEPELLEVPVDPAQEAVKPDRE